MARAPEEISAWSIEELEAEIHAALPQGWTLSSRHASDGYWEFAVKSVTEESEPLIRLERENADRRLGLLDVYGWLWLEGLPKPPAGSPWAPRRELTVGIVTGHANVKGSSIPDPEDLDPAEVARVHQSRK